MEYDKIFEECNQITPYFFIGEPRTDQKLQNGSMIGYLQTMNGKLSVISDGMIKLEDTVNKILNDEDMLFIKFVWRVYKPKVMRNCKVSG